VQVSTLEQPAKLDNNIETANKKEIILFKGFIMTSQTL
jgi:hypothetical protein